MSLSNKSLQVSQKLIREGRIFDARDLLEAARQELPNDTDILSALGKVYLATKQPEKAVRVFTLVLDLKQNKRFPSIIDTNDEGVSEADLEYINEQAENSGFHPGIKKPLEKSSGDAAESAGATRNGSISIPPVAPAGGQANLFSLTITNQPPRSSEQPQFDLAPAPGRTRENSSKSTIPRQIDLLKIPSQVEASELMDPVAAVEEEEEKYQATFEQPDEKVPFNEVLSELVSDIESDGITENDLEFFSSEEVQGNDDSFDPLANDFEEVVREPVDRAPLLLPKGVSRLDRSRQIAVYFIEKWGWAKSDLKLVTSIFYTYGWSAARVSLEREAEYGLTSEELEVALFARELWGASDKFWIAFSKNNQTQPVYKVLSWRLAILICRHFRGVPSVWEVESLLENEFDSWFSSPILNKQFTAFIKYLFFRITGGAQMLPAGEMGDFGAPDKVIWDDASDLGLTDLVWTEQEALLLQAGFRIYEGPREHLPSAKFYHCNAFGEFPRDINIEIAEADIAEPSKLEEMVGLKKKLTVREKRAISLRAERAALIEERAARAQAFADKGSHKVYASPKLDPAKFPQAPSHRFLNEDPLAGIGGTKNGQGHFSASPQLKKPRISDPNESAARPGASQFLSSSAKRRLRDS